MVVRSEYLRLGTSSSSQELSASKTADLGAPGVRGITCMGSASCLPTSCHAIHTRLVDMRKETGGERRREVLRIVGTIIPQNWGLATHSTEQCLPTSRNERVAVSVYTRARCFGLLTHSSFNTSQSQQQNVLPTLPRLTALKNRVQTSKVLASLTTSHSFIYNTNHNKDLQLPYYHTANDNAR